MISGEGSCSQRRKRDSSKERVQEDLIPQQKTEEEGHHRRKIYSGARINRCTSTCTTGAKRSVLVAISVAAAWIGIARVSTNERGVVHLSTSKGSQYPRVHVYGVLPDDTFDDKYLAALGAVGRTVDYQRPPKHQYRIIEGGHEPFEKGNCVAMREWQRGNHPTCNLIHEMNIGIQDDEEDYQSEAEIINNGWYRLVWRVPQFDGVPRVLKTLLYKHEFERSIIELHRRDSVAVDHLTRSPHTTNMHGFCATASTADYSHGGDIKVAVRSGLTARRKLEISWQVASAVADAQDLDGDGMATIALRDVSSSQFILDSKDGLFKLTDFNMAVFMTWEEDTHEPCPFSEGSTADIVRSPEEYLHSKHLTEKIDSFSLGDVLHYILTGGYPFRSEGHSMETIKQNVIEGRRPRTFDAIAAGHDPIELAILRAVEMTRPTDPKKRASVREVATSLKDELSKVVLW